MLFDLVELAFFLWSGVLLVVGVRTVHGWTLARAGAACAIAVVAPLAVVLLLRSV